MDNPNVRKNNLNFDVRCGGCGFRTGNVKKDFAKKTFRRAYHVSKAVEQYKGRDNERNDEIAAEILGMTGIIVERAVDGVEAVDLVETCQNTEKWI